MPTVSVIGSNDEPTFSREGPAAKARVTFEAMLVGYGGALDRFEAASKNQDPIATYTALFEALNWAVALDDRTDQDLLLWKKQFPYEWRTRVHDAEVMSGIRYVRNSVHHDWSDAVCISESGTAYPKTFPRVYSEWVWRPVDELPPPSKPPHAESERFYEEQLQGRAVRHSLHALQVVFRTLHVLLEPYTFKGDEDPADRYPQLEDEAGIPPE